MVKPNILLLDVLRKQDILFGKVRQTAVAAPDFRFLVVASKLAGKKTIRPRGLSTCRVCRFRALV
jgi:hypothetical protein